VWHRSECCLLQQRRSLLAEQALLQDGQPMRRQLLRKGSDVLQRHHLLQQRPGLLERRVLSQRLHRVRAVRMRAE